MNIKKHTTIVNNLLEEYNKTLNYDILIKVIDIHIKIKNYYKQEGLTLEKEIDLIIKKLCSLVVRNHCS